MGLSHEVSTRLAEQLGRRRWSGRRCFIRRYSRTGDHARRRTISAIHELERHGLRAMLISAVETATRRSRELTQSLTAKFGGEQ
jgi:hypothetical protein